MGKLPNFIITSFILLTTIFAFIYSFRYDKELEKPLNNAIVTYVHGEKISLQIE